MVASFTDAWIETFFKAESTIEWAVASFTDAWIETGYANRCYKSRRSHLLQMRGLKHRDAAVFKLQQESHLLQMRGLKLCVVLNNNLLSHVASFTDAWIETHRRSSGTTAIMVASFTDAWIETDKYFIKLSLSLSHLLQMRGLKQLTPLPVC